MALGVAAGKRVVVRVYHGGTRQQNATEWGGDANKVSVHSARCGMTKSINLIAPAFVTMSAAISAVKPNKITRMCLMLMPNDAATSPPNAKTIRCRIAGFDSATSLPRMLFANHSVPSCWQVFGLRWVVECGGACGAAHRTGPTVKPLRTTFCMTPTHHHNR